MVTTLVIAGMSCVHCTRAVFTAFGGVPAITRADVSIGRAVVEHDGSVSDSTLRNAVQLAGYELMSVTHDRRALPITQ